ncbi:MAG: hypothetical protein Q7T55_18795, partial [Solirubrobacteraceae bacterium]|nr:hypothetical protein [Solirubrobacteraceae bacterium]
QMVALLGPFSHVISAEAPAGGTTTIGVTPEEALAAGVTIERDPSAESAPAAPAKKPATRISKETIAAEKQAAAEAERKAQPRPRSPRGGDAPF